MIDDILQMLLNEARLRDNQDFLKGLYSAWDDLRDKVHLIVVDQERLRSRKKREKEVDK